MREEKVRSNYSRLTDYELATLAGRVVKAMQEQETVDFFADPEPEIEELEALVDDYISKHEIASRRGSALEVGLKNDSRKNVLVALRTLAHYVNEKARGQISKLLSTGLQLIGQPARVEEPSIPEEVKLKDGALSGQIRVSFKSIKNAWMYEIQVAQEPESGLEIEWTESLNTTVARGTVIPNLVPTVRYFFRVRAMNGKGTGDWSEPVSTIVR